MRDPSFKILAHVDHVPSMAACSKCGYKLFTPLTAFGRDSRRAEAYLMGKFAEHECPARKKPMRSASGLSAMLGMLKL